MFRLLRLISYPHLRASWGRTALVVGGIATGVSLIVAINVINASVLASVAQTFALIAGPADLEVALGGGEIGFPESALATVRADSDVRTAVPLVRGTVSLADTPEETVQLFGAELTAEEDLKRYLVAVTDRRAASAALTDPHAILVTSSFAQRHRLHVGGTLALSTPRGVREFTVRGLLEPQGLAAAFGGQLAVMDLAAAQNYLAKDGKIDQIDVVLRDGVDIAAARAQLVRALPPTLDVAPPQQRGSQYESVLNSFQVMLTAFSLLCLVAGVYIIYSTTSTGAAHRAFVVAGVRLIGGDADQLFRLLMTEAFVLGLVGAALGVASGLLLARLLIGMVTDSMGIIFQMRFPAHTLTIDWSQQAAIGAIGVVAALFASYFAARHVTAIEPLDVIRDGSLSVRPRVPVRSLATWWVVLVAVSVAAFVLEVRFKSVAWGNFGSTLWFASSIVIATPLICWLRPAISRLLARLFSAEGRFATESLFRAPMRTGTTIAAIALVLTVAITVASLLTSCRSAVTAYFVGGFLASDLVVSAVATEGGWLETPLPESVVSELAAIPGVRGAESLRVLPGQFYRGERISVVGGSDGLCDPARYPAGWYHEGDPVRAGAALIAGEGANVSTSLSDRFGLHVGDRIELATPTGVLALPIVGVVPDYTSDRGSVIVNRRVVTRWWDDHSVNRVNLFVEPTVSVEDVRGRIAQAVGARYRLKILQLRDVVKYHADMINHAFAFVDAIQLLIIIVTIAGVFDLLVSAILERRRELALWRLVGADEHAVRRSVLVESGTIGAVGAALGVAIGFVTALVWVRINFRYLLGYYIDFEFAWRSTLWFVALALVTTALAGWAASAQAVRQLILDGIRQD